MSYNNARVPPEILDQICEVLENPQLFQPRSNLVPLCCVCKYWKSVAEPRLYSAIAIGDVYAISGKPSEIVTPLLARTLSENENLAKLVDNLFLFTAQRTEVESLAHAAILASSANAVHVAIKGYSNGTQGEIHTALASLKKLQVLEVSRGRPAGLGSARAFCTIPELLQLMSKWPRLRWVEMHPGSLDDSLDLFDDESRGTISTPGCCPFLRDFKCEASVFSAFQLRLLASMAPSISSFCAGVEKTDSGISALAHCLETWSSSLVCFRISSILGESSTITPLNSSASLHLDNLQLLCASSVYILPSALQHCPALEFLMYTVDAAGIEDLISVLRSSSTLNSLKDMVVYHDWKGFMPGSNIARNMIVLRKLCEEKCIAFR